MKKIYCGIVLQSFFVCGFMYTTDARYRVVPSNKNSFTHHPYEQHGMCLQEDMNKREASQENPYETIIQLKKENKALSEQINQNNTEIGDLKKIVDLHYKNHMQQQVCFLTQIAALQRDIYQKMVAMDLEKQKSQRLTKRNADLQEQVIALTAHWNQTENRRVAISMENSRLKEKNLRLKLALNSKK